MKLSEFISKRDKLYNGDLFDRLIRYQGVKRQWDELKGDLVCILIIYL
jgi:hypothetical protein